jgi:hypothetical protein
MRRSLALTLLALLLSLCAARVWAEVVCPIDGSSAHYTGETKSDEITGKLLKLYECARGHEFWVAADSE